MGLFCLRVLIWRLNSILVAEGSVSDLAGAILGGWDRVWFRSSSGPWAVVAGRAHSWVRSRSGSCKGVPFAGRVVSPGGCGVGHGFVVAEVTHPAGSAPCTVREPFPGFHGRKWVFYWRRGDCDVNTLKQDCCPAFSYLNRYAVLRKYDFLWPSRQVGLARNPKLSCPSREARRQYIWASGACGGGGSCGGIAWR